MAGDKVEAASYSQFACIGAGISAIGLGATLKRWYGITDVRFFERHNDLGGTWHANTYPGTVLRSSLPPPRNNPCLGHAVVYNRVI